MATIRYKYENFNCGAALQGALVLMISDSYEPPVGVPYKSIVSKVPSSDSASAVPVDNPSLKGAGIIVDKTTHLDFIVNSVAYTFNKMGEPTSTNATGWKLYMGYNLDSPQEAGNAIGTSYTAATTRGATGTVTTYDFGQGSTVVVGQLNARDAFAMQALQGIMDHIKKPDGVSDTEIAFYTAMAYKWAANMMSAAAQARSEYTDETSTGQDVDPTTLTDNTEKILNNIKEVLEKTDTNISIDGDTKKAEVITIPELNKLIEAYVKHTPEEGEPASKTTVGLDDLIEAIKNIQGGGGGGTTEVDFTPLIDAINAKQVAGELTAQFGNAGLGRDSEHPIYISGGGFPSRQVLASAFTGAIIHDFLTFNEAGAVGYSTKEEVKKVILGYLNAYADLAALSTAIYNSISSTIDKRIKAWLEAAKDAEGRNLTVNTPT